MSDYQSVRAASNAARSWTGVHRSWLTARVSLYATALLALPAAAMQQDRPTRPQLTVDQHQQLVTPEAQLQQALAVPPPHLANKLTDALFLMYSQARTMIERNSFTQGKIYNCLGQSKPTQKTGSSSAGMLSALTGVTETGTEQGISSTFVPSTPFDAPLAIGNLGFSMIKAFNDLRVQNKQAALEKEKRNGRQPHQAVEIFWALDAQGLSAGLDEIGFPPLGAKDQYRTHFKGMGKPDQEKWTAAVLYLGQILAWENATICYDHLLKGKKVDDLYSEEYKTYRVQTQKLNAKVEELKKTYQNQKVTALKDGQIFVGKEHKLTIAVRDPPPEKSFANALLKAFLADAKQLQAWWNG